MDEPQRRTIVLDEPADALRVWSQDSEVAAGLSVECPADDGPQQPQEVPPAVAGRGLLLALLTLLVIAVVAGVGLLRPFSGPATQPAPAAGERVEASVTAVRQSDCGPGASAAPGLRCLEVDVRLLSGPEAGQAARVVTGNDASTVGTVGTVGSRVTLSGTVDPVTGQQSYRLVDVERTIPLAALGGLLLLAVLALARLRGLLALLAVSAAVAVVVAAAVPLLRAGRPPLLTALLAGAAVLVVVLLVRGGPTVHTAVALLGSAGGLLLTLGLSWAAVTTAGLTGLTGAASELAAVPGRIDPRGLLLAGVVLGALGLLAELCLAQVRTVEELRRADPALSARALYATAMRRARPRVAAGVTVLGLAYAGAALPLLVLLSASGNGLPAALTGAAASGELLRTAAGLLGLLAALPLTTALAAATYPQTVDPDADEAPLSPFVRVEQRPTWMSRPLFDETQWAERAAGEDQDAVSEAPYGVRVLAAGEKAPTKRRGGSDSSD